MRRLRARRPHLLLFVYGLLVLCAMVVVGGLPRF
jgi:hypothetical protein